MEQKTFIEENYNNSIHTDAVTFFEAAKLEGLRIVSLWTE